MKDHTVAERHGLARLERVAAVAGTREVLHTKGVGGEEAVGPHMPEGWIAEARRVIEHGDAEGLAVDGALIIDPIGTLGPGGAVLIARAVDDAAAEFGIDLHRFGDADTKAPFLGIAERDRAIARLERDGEIDPGLLGLAAEDQAALVFEDPLAVAREPVVPRNDQPLGASRNLNELAVLDGVFVPEAQAVHAAVVEPERAVVGMILPLALVAIVHGIGAGHRLAGRAQDRPDGRRAADIGDVAGERLAVDGDRDAVVALLNGDFGRRERGEDQEGGQRGQPGEAT